VVKTSAKIAAVLQQQEKRHTAMTLRQMQTPRSRFQFKFDENADIHHLFSTHRETMRDWVASTLARRTRYEQLDGTCQLGPKDKHGQAYQTPSMVPYMTSSIWDMENDVVKRSAKLEHCGYAT
jgi:hypothetical protein